MKIIPLLASLFLSTITYAAPSRPWDVAFSPDPLALWKEASTVPVPEGADVVILLEEERYTYDAAGRESHVRRIVARIVTNAGADSWANTSTHWRPWLQDKPKIRARIITSDGQAHLLDPKTIVEAPVKKDSNESFSDARDLEAPLPAVAAGAVVEEEFTTQDRVAAFDAGMTNSVFFRRSKTYPAMRTLLVLESPASLPLHYAIHNIPGMQPVKDENNGLVRLLFESGPLTTDFQSLPLLAPDARHASRVIFSTGQSWQKVAATYGAIVDKQIAGADLRTLLTGVSTKGTPREIAAQLLARVQKQVRYAAVELGEAAFVPRSPAETLQRHYGDCKDQASLMVALLRASGVKAVVALTNLASSGDPEPELPGFGQFDHAIVYVPGPPDFWIDPTDIYSGAGEIPMDEQGRYALPASADTTSMIRVPESVAADNRQIETRTVELGAEGLAKVTEVTEAWGARTTNFRSLESFGSTKLKEDLSDYVKRVYLTSSITRAAVTHKGLELPARLLIEVDQSKRGLTSLADAALYIRLEAITNLLPNYFTVADEEEADKKTKDNTPRTHDLLLPEPFVYEIRYHVIAPAGFVPGPLPASDNKTWGTAKFSQEYKSQPDGTIDAVIRLDTGPRRMSPANAEALRAGVQEIEHSNAVKIVFEQKGMALLQGGKIREAMDEFRSLAAAHPKAGIHHTQMALAFLAAGLGEPARAEARRAVEVQPDSFTTNEKLAWILQNDLLGRSYKPGYDLKASEAACRAAIKVDPKNVDARLRLAGLLEHNAAGEWYGAGSRLQDALDEYKAIGKDLDATDFAANPVFDLFYMGRFADAKEAALKLPASARRYFLVLAGTAATSTPEAAIRESNLLVPDNVARRTALEQAADLMQRLRLYDKASKLIAASAQGSSNAAASLSRANLIGQVKRREDLKFSPDDPASPVLQFFAALFAEDLDQITNTIQRIHGNRPELTPDADEIDEFKNSARGARAGLSALGLPLAVSSDVIMSLVKTTNEGDADSGFRIRTKGAGAGGNMTAFVKRQGSGYIMLDTAEDPNAIGYEILDLAAKGDLAAARHWLDWVRESNEIGGGDDPLAGLVFARFWTRGNQGDRAAIELAAASLLTSLKHDAKGIPILKARLEANPAPEARPYLQLALAESYLKKSQYVEAESPAEQLLKQYPESLTAFWTLEESLQGQRKWQEMRQAADDRLKRVPNDPAAIRRIGAAFAHEGKYLEATAQYRRLITLGKVAPGDWNEIGWLSLFYTPMNDALISEVLEGAGQNPSPGILHTIAMMMADAGKITEARDVLWQSMDKRGFDAPDDGVWLVLGRIAESLGARDNALAAYGKVGTPKNTQTVLVSSYDLAQRRIALIKK